MLESVAPIGKWGMSVSWTEDKDVPLGRLVALMPNIPGFTPKMSGVKKALRRIKALNDENVMLVKSTFIGLLTGAQKVGVKLNFHRPATLFNIMAKQATGNGRLLPPLYKGVSYNPAGANWNEWLVLLDFFAIMRRFVTPGREGIQTAVLDASLYWMVNLLGEEGLILTSPDPSEATVQLLAQLRNHVVRRSPDPTMYEIALQRNSYMRAIAERFPASSAPPVFSVLDVWNDPGFVEFLAVAIRNFCEHQKNGRWKVTKAVSYQRYMTYSPWVTPLVAAEQSFMAARSGFQLFLAPVQEAAWNSVVDEMCRLTQTPLYSVFMYDRPNSGEIAYGDFPFFSDMLPALTGKLARNPVLLPIIAGYVAPFLGLEDAHYLQEMVEQGCVKTASEMIFAFISQIHTRALELYDEGFSELPLDNLGWLMQFPPGTC